MIYLMEILVFFVKVLIIVGLISIPLFIAIAALKGRRRRAAEGGARVELVDVKKDIEKRKRRMAKTLRQSQPKQILDRKDAEVNKKKDKKPKASVRAREKLLKSRTEREEYVKTLKNAQGRGEFCPENMFIIDFKGSPTGKEVKKLRAQVDALLDVATDKDEVVVNLTSPGGMVNSYGLCASQLVRIRDRGIRLVCTVDSVAASGGYLMACVADRIVAAPFSYIGSIGVIAAIPNFNRLMDKHQIDYEQVTAGKYKRTLTVFGKNTEEGREKFKEELEAIHDRFKEQVLKYRPALDLDRVATGEHWLALDALKLGLVDEIATSDEYIEKRAYQTFNCVMKLEYKQNKDKSILAKIKKLVKLKSLSGQIEKELMERIERADGQQFMHIK